MTVRHFLFSYKNSLATRVVILRLDKSGRAVSARKFKWTGPGWSDPNFSWAGPRRFLPIFREDFANIPRRFRQYSLFFFEKTILNLKCVNNKVTIFFKKSFKNTDRNKIQHDRPGPAQDFSWAVTARPEDLQPCLR